MHVAPASAPGAARLTPHPVIRDMLSWSATAGASLTSGHPGIVDAGSYNRASVRKLVLAELQPPPDAAAQQRELDLMHEIRHGRTDEQTERARALAASGEEKLWKLEFERLQGQSPLADAARGAAMLDEAIAAAGSIARSAKYAYQRPRPFSVDPSLEPVVRKPPGSTSYPSGHGARAFAAATVLGALWPEHAEALANTANEVAFSRTYGGVHFPSDIAAGAFVGAAAGAAVMTGFHPQQ